MYKAFPLYEGDEPYLYISYDPKDQETVSVLIDDLDMRGYRIWYDDGRHDGPEYISVLTEKISNCSFFICFLSANYDHSEFCMRELHYAFNHRKPIIPICPKGTVLEPETAFRLSAAPRFRLTESGMDEDFLQRFSSHTEEFFAPCLHTRGFPDTEPEKKKSFLDLFRRKR